MADRPRHDPPAPRPGRTAGAAPKRGKIVTLDELLARRRGARQMGLTVVQCHGCFDIVHPGHIRHLRQARSHGDILLVTITGDAAYVKRSGAPLIPEELRAENLAELDCVDWVCIDPSPTAEALLQRVQPDVYIKGREYEHNSDPRFLAERRAVEAAGGRIVFSSGDVVFSSTALIAALERSADPYQARLSQLLDRPDLSGPALHNAVARFRGVPAVVVGEVIRDVYTLCDQPEVASESPVMTLRPLEHRQYDGGAAIIARHLAAMGARPTLVTALPEGPETDALVARLAAEGVEVRSVPCDQPLPEKQRFLVGAQKVMKLNNVRPLVLDAARQDALARLAADAAGGAACAVVADFALGLFSAGSIDAVTGALRPRVGTLAGDVSGRRAALTRFHAYDLLCPSERELRDALNCHDQGLASVAWDFMQRTATRTLIVTMGADGLVAFEPRASALQAGADFVSSVTGEHVPALCGHAADPLGCGDALLAAAALATAAGLGAMPSAFLGSVAAAAEAQRLGNIPISAADLRHGVVRIHTARLAWDPARADTTAAAIAEPAHAPATA
ncbi:MAG: adenylyltransferase/cytidyltransferase family protein [Phycisphaeraceae bacterium]|nr:adenylyltransferase/cytidyltransferase family protein [Phycisphaeraceae bacterium]